MYYKFKNIKLEIVSAVYNVDEKRNSYFFLLLLYAVAVARKGKIKDYSSARVLSRRLMASVIFGISSLVYASEHDRNTR